MDGGGSGIRCKFGTGDKVGIALAGRLILTTIKQVICDYDAYSIKAVLYITDEGYVLPEFCIWPEYSIKDNADELLKDITNMLNLCKNT